MLVHNFLTKKSTNIPQAPYLPDLDPRDYFLLSKLKLPFREKRFEAIEAEKRKFAEGAEGHTLIGLRKPF